MSPFNVSLPIMLCKDINKVIYLIINKAINKNQKGRQTPDQPFASSNCDCAVGLCQSRADDVTARGGAGLPRRSLCNAFTLLLLEPGANFKSRFMWSTGEEGTPQRCRYRSNSPSHQCSRAYWSCKAEKCSLLSGLVSLEATQLTDASSYSSPPRMLSMLCE